MQGKYLTGSVTGNGAFHYYSTGTHTLVISGGYTSNCGSRSLNAALTVLDGRHVTQVLSLSSANGLIAVDRLTLQNGEGGTPGAGLQVNYLASVNNDVHVMNNIIRDNHSSVDAGGVYVSGAGENTWLFNNLIAGNSADSQYGAGYITGYGHFNEIIANTVTANTSAYHGPNGDPVGGLFCGGSRFCQLYNNIFWNNTTYGIFLGNTGAAMAYNDYGTLGGIAPASSTGDVSVAPKFVNPGAGNYRLGSGSPCPRFLAGTPQPDLMAMPIRPPATWTLGRTSICDRYAGASVSIGVCQTTLLSSGSGWAGRDGARREEVVMRLVLGVFLCILCAPSSAAVFCATTPQELRDAFVAAQNNSQNNTVKIARGNYNTGGTQFVYFTGGSTTDGNLIVRGGFNADCHSDPRSFADRIGWRRRVGRALRAQRYWIPHRGIPHVAKCRTVNRQSNRVVRPNRFGRCHCSF